MTHNYLEYELVDGYIHNWLVAGPLQTAGPLVEPPSPPEQTPTERVVFEVDGQPLKWAYYRCLQDHLVDLTGQSGGAGQVNAWAYVEVKTSNPISTNLTVFAPGPVQVWLNGKLLKEAGEAETPARPLQHAAWLFQAPLQDENNLFICFNAAKGFHTLAVHLGDIAQNAPPGVDGGPAVTVRVPTLTMFPHRHKIFEQLFDNAYLEKSAHHMGNLINIRWDENAEMTTSYSYKVRDDHKQIYVEGNAEVKLEPYDAGHPQRLWERPYHIALQATGREYWEQDLRYERVLPLYVLDTGYVSTRQEKFPQRRELALEHASRREPHLYAEIAKMVVENWEKVSAEYILAAVEDVSQGAPDRHLSLVGLLGMLYRYQGNENFPQEVVQPIENCVLEFDYTVPEDEGVAILRHAAAILAGGLYPQKQFRQAGLSGTSLRQEAEPAVQEWIRRQGTLGLTAWSSPLAIEQMVVALSHLTSLAENEAVRELSAILLDKILFLLAVNSHKGTYGTAHAVTSANAVKSAQLEATSGISRLLFGVGVYNPYIAGPVSLACSDYEFPSFFFQIATNPPPELLHKERQVRLDGHEVNLVTYRTPDTLLSSVQDYNPGQMGTAEHVWQATLSADAIVYTNHPAAMGEQEGRAPGFWLGNGLLPRIAQWKDSLVAVYSLPADDWMGYTHAYFPTYAFDEYVFARGWAFARLGDGFVGLTCSQDFELVKTGPGAMRELRSAGQQNVWLCITGRKAVYGGFRKFQKSCMAIKPAWREAGVSFQSLQGDAIDFGWENPLLVNGEMQPLSGSKHIDNPYCSVEAGASQMEIQYGDYLMRLNFD